MEEREIEEETDIGLLALAIEERVQDVNRGVGLDRNTRLHSQCVDLAN